jgi:hypothetical protein
MFLQFFEPLRASFLLSRLITLNNGEKYDHKEEFLSTVLLTLLSKLKTAEKYLL